MHIGILAFGGLAGLICALLNLAYGESAWFSALAGYFAAFLSSVVLISVCFIADIAERRFGTLTFMQNSGERSRR